MTGPAKSECAQPLHLGAAWLVCGPAPDRHFVLGRFKAGVEPAHRALRGFGELPDLAVSHASILAQEEMQIIGNSSLISPYPQGERT